ncbi:unnamed protein product, partial [Rotaria sp. Silwood2]
DVFDPNLVSILVTESYSDHVVPHTMKSISNDKKHYEISFIPNIACQHIVLISYNGKLLSTNHVNVCNINKIHVSSINNGIVGKPLIFSVDTHGVGDGHLEVTISDGQRILPAELKSNETKIFNISFIPEISGLHSIIVSFNGIHIEGSPFMINIDDPSISDDKSLDEDDDNDFEFLIGGQLEGTKVDEIAWVICETSLTDKYEDFSLYVTDPDKIIIKHTRIQDFDGRWRIEFEPTKTGIYQIQTGSDKPQITLASMDVLSLECERYIYGERIVYSNAHNFISIISDNDDIKVQLISSNNNEIPIEMEKHLLEWKIYYSLTATGHYQLSIIDNDEKQLFDIYCIAEKLDIFRNGGIEDITRLIIDRNKIIGDDINVIVKDALAHTIPAAFYRNLSRDLVIEYIPVRIGIHEIFIRTQNNLLDICPIRIMAFCAQKSYEPVLRVQVKEVLEHIFQGIIDENNQLEISIADPFERPIPFQRSKNEHGELKISLSPVRVGTHWICISNDDNDSFAVLPVFAYDDDYVLLSPIDRLSPHEKTISNGNNNNNHHDTPSTIDSLSPGREFTTISETSEFRPSRQSSISPIRIPSPIKETATITSSIDLSEPSKSPTINDRSSPEVQTLDISDLIDPCVHNISKFSFKDPNDKFNIIIHDANGDVIGYKTEHLSDGRKCISYEPTVVGLVKIHLLKEKGSINESLFIVHAFDPSAVHLINFSKNILINTTNLFHIDPTKAGKGTLKIIITDSNNQSLPLFVQKQSNNQITVQFKPIVLGLHTVLILFNQIPITGTPFQVLVENIEQQSKVKNTRSFEIEEREHSINSKHELLLLAQQQEKPHSLSSQTRHSLLVKSNDILVQQKDFLLNKEHEREQILKSQYIPLNEAEIRRLQLIKEKFEHGQPIDVVF